MVIEARDLVGRSKRPRQVKARALACYWMVDEMGIPEVDVGHELGITQPAVSKCVTRGREVASSQRIRLER
jgi:predicted transcriptional regulator